MRYKDTCSLYHY